MAAPMTTTHQAACPAADFSFQTPFPSPYFDTGLSALVRGQIVLLVSMVMAVYLREVVGRVAKPGYTRLLLSLPIYVSNLAVASLFDYEEEIFFRFAAFFAITWLASFKAIAYCVNRGPLLLTNNLVQFAVVYCIPIVPMQATSNTEQRGRLCDEAGTPLQLVLRFMGKLAFMGFNIYVLTLPHLPKMVQQFCYSMILWCFLEGMMDGPAALAVAPLGLKISPTFDWPLMSTSIFQFWGQRWDVSVSSHLRMLFYEPIMDGSFVKKERKQPLSNAQITATITPSSTGKDEKAAAPAPTDAPVPAPAPSKDEPKADSAPAAATPPARKSRQPAWVKLVATQATYLASGLVHEFLLWWLMPNGCVGWKWTTFFVIQCPVQIFEQKYLLPFWRKNKLPFLNPWVSRVVTIGLIMIMAYFFWWAPIETDRPIVALFLAALGRYYVLGADLVASAFRSYAPLVGFKA